MNGFSEIHELSEVLTAGSFTLVRMANLWDTAGECSSDIASTYSAVCQAAVERIWRECDAHNEWQVCHYARRDHETICPSSSSAAPSVKISGRQYSQTD